MIILSHTRATIGLSRRNTPREVGSPDHDDSEKAVRRVGRRMSVICLGACADWSNQAGGAAGSTKRREARVNKNAWEAAGKVNGE